MDRIVLTLSFVWVFAFDARAEDVLTFFAWSDQHVTPAGEAAHLAPAADAMNNLAGMAYPQAIGGKVEQPAFVFGCGDMTEWPSAAARDAYAAASKRLHFPTYDIIGNHDEGGKVPRPTMKDWIISRHKALSYTFDKGGVHFLAVYSEYNEDLNNPAQAISNNALEFIRADLAKTPKGRPVIVALHLCLDAITNRDELVRAFGDANVILVLGGHYHKATVGEYAGYRFVQIPSPQSTTEFTVIRINSDRLVAIPYDYKKKAWDDNPRVRLDVPVKVHGNSGDVSTPAPGTPGEGRGGGRMRDGLPRTTPTLTLPRSTGGGENSPSTRPAKLMMIVAPNALHAALADFVAFKRREFSVELVSLEKILASTQGVDDPERLKRCLYDAWRLRGLRYVLLVGDADVLPVRYMVLDRVTPAAFDYAFYASDLYYADLAKPDGSFEDWNARKDSFHRMYFGEVRGEKNKSDPINYDQVDYRPEIAVGRWPASTPADVSLIAAKSMAYEKGIRSAERPGLHKAVLLSVGGWVDSRSAMDQVCARLQGHFSPEKLYYFDARRNDHTPPPNEAQVLAALNGGASLLMHAGHGSGDTWERCFSVRSLRKVHNADRLPIMISAGCSTAVFANEPPYTPYIDVDGKVHTGTYNKEVFAAPPPPPAAYQKGSVKQTGLAKKLLLNGPDGAAAYIGCNTGSQPCGLTLLLGFASAVQKHAEPRLGDCWAEAVAYYYDKEHLADLKPNNDWYPPSIFFQAMKFMVFGDPTLPLPAVERTR